MPRRTRWTSAATTLLVTLAASDACPNGRFPQANHLVLGPGARNDLIVLRATFGLVLSRDRGAHWDWVCEEALDAVGSFDPSIALGSDRRIALGLPDGMRVSTLDHCAWTTPRDPPPSVTDITQDALGEVMFAAGTEYGGPSATTRVYRSDDRGQGWRVVSQVSAFIVETIDVAPGDPRRVYLSGYRPGAVGSIYRSEDGGMSFQLQTARFPDLASVWIAAVHPTNPSRLWLRVAAGLGTELHRSDDGGASSAAIATSGDPMDGFALSDDGETVWYGTANRDAGIFRSVRGAAFARVRGAASVRCMRHHGGLLFVCADEATDGYSLAWSGDGGDTLNPLMSVRDIRGPLAGCAGDGGVSATCGPVWAQFAPQLRDLDAATSPPRVPLPIVDAGVMDASPEDAARDGALTDLGAPDAHASDIADAAHSPDRGPAIMDVVDRDAADATESPSDRPSVSDGASQPDRHVPDAGAPAADVGRLSARGACDCAAAPTGVPPPWWAAVLGGALTASRRRRRGAHRR